MCNQSNLMFLVISWGAINIIVTVACTALVLAVFGRRNPAVSNGERQ